MAIMVTGRKCASKHCLAILPDKPITNQFDALESEFCDRCLRAAKLQESETELLTPQEYRERIRQRKE